MNCQRWEQTLLDIARGAAPQHREEEALRHAAGCDACAAYLDTQRRLTEALGALAMETPTASPRLEAAVAARFRAHSRSRRRASGERWLRIAASVVVIVSAAVLLLRSGTAVPPAPAEDLRGFFPVPYRTATLDRGYLVRVTMPRTALVTLGMPVAAGTPEVVQAELLVADDGMAQAVRLVR